jgi:predicted SnoaL-like aldol condensation-catalyzing enzyme
MNTTTPMGSLDERRATQSMSAEQNKATVRRFYEEVWNKGNVDFALEVFAEDYTRHDLRPTEALPGPEGQRKIAADFRTAFPDLEWKVDLIFAEGDLVAGRWSARGTNTGRGVAPNRPARGPSFRGSTSSGLLRVR